MCVIVMKDKIQETICTVMIIILIIFHFSIADKNKSVENV